MKLSKLFRTRKSRKYPIRRDEQGQSLRARCFAMFEKGERPSKIAKELKANEATVFRYYRDWKRRSPNFEQQYAFVKSLFSKTSPERDKNLELFSRECGISKEEFEVILSTSHGLRRFLTGKYYFPVQADANHKLSVALELATLISNHLLSNGGKFSDVYHALRRLMKQFKNYRGEEDADVEEDNKIMEMIRKIIAADLENERQGRVKPVELSEEERRALMKRGMEQQIKSTEITYWLRIGFLMADGLTEEQAREKIYQDLVDQGNLKAAELLRELQEKVHPLNKTNEHGPPSSPQ